MSIATKKMRGPEIDSVWIRCDGAILKVTEVHKQAVFAEVLVKPDVIDKRFSASAKIVQHVRSDFCDELGNTYMIRVSPSQTNCA